MLVGWDLCGTALRFFRLVCCVYDMALAQHFTTEIRDLEYRVLAENLVGLGFL